jgi:outer membrane lipoprotein-sorting protein
MRRSKVLFILILVSLALLASGCEEKMGAEEIAAKMQEKQASLEDYSGTILTTIYLDEEKSQEEVRVMYKKPNLMKSLVIDKQGKEKVEAVSDGEYIWSYDASTNTVTKMKLPREPLLKENDYIKLISNFLNESEVSILGVEEVDGRGAYVLEAEPKNKENVSVLFLRTKVWVDKETWMVLKCNMYDNKGNLTTEVGIRDLKINTGIPDSEFQFNVPAGAEVKTVDLDKEFKAPENLTLEKARQQATFVILIPDYIPEGYALNSTTVYNNSNLAPEGHASETSTLTYIKGQQSFDIMETVYQTVPEDDTPMQGAEKISINGREGRYFNGFGDLKILQWQLGEVEISLSGSLERSEMLKIAESIQEPFTEFYILGPEGKADNYPTNYVLGENGTLIVGITNHEYRHVNYTMDIRLKNTSLPLSPDQKHISLGHNDTSKKAITITPPFEGTNMELEFLLFNEIDNSMPYRNLNLWINVSGKPKEA